MFLEERAAKERDVSPTTATLGPPPPPLLASIRRSTLPPRRLSVAILWPDVSRKELALTNFISITE